MAWQSADAIVYSECGCPSDSPLTTAVAHAQLLTNRIQGVSRAAKGVIQEIPCQLFLVIIQWYKWRDLLDGMIKVNTEFVQG